MLASSRDGAAGEGDYFCIEALAVAVRVPRSLAVDYAAFPRVSVDPAVKFDETAPLAFSAAFTREVADRTPYLAVHAGVVSGNGGAIVIPGGSGLGKSTLVAALVQVGFGYLSDEMAAVDADGSVHAFPRPISLDATACELLGLPRPVAADEVTLLPASLGTLGPAHAPVTTILLVERGVPLSISPAAPSEAAAAMIRHSFNHYRRPAASLAAIAALVRTAAVLRVGYPSAPALAAALAASSLAGR